MHSPIRQWMSHFDHKSMCNLTISNQRKCPQHTQRERYIHQHNHYVCVAECVSVCNNKQWIATICRSACSLLLMFLDLWKCLVVSSKSEAIQPQIQVPLITFSFTYRFIHCRKLKLSPIRVTEERVTNGKENRMKHISGKIERAWER